MNKPLFLHNSHNFIYDTELNIHSRERLSKIKEFLDSEDRVTFREFDTFIPLARPLSETSMEIIDTNSILLENVDVGDPQKYHNFAKELFSMTPEDIFNCYPESRKILDYTHLNLYLDILKRPEKHNDKILHSLMNDRYGRIPQERGIHLRNNKIYYISKEIITGKIQIQEMLDNFFSKDFKPIEKAFRPFDDASYKEFEHMCKTGEGLENYGYIKYEGEYYNYSNDSLYILKLDPININSFKSILLGNFQEWRDLLSQKL